MMAHPIDALIIAVSFASFAVFFILQMIFFRLMHQEAVLKAIMVIFVLTSLGHFMASPLIAGTLGPQAALSTGETILIALLSYLLFGLAAFVYILCVFGPSETSIRIRVVREIFEGEAHGLSHTELLGRYNAKMVLERRLERLLRSGEIIERNGKYILIKKANFFFMIDTVANLIHGFIKSK